MTEIRTSSDYAFFVDNDDISMTKIGGGVSNNLQELRHSKISTEEFKGNINNPISNILNMVKDPTHLTNTWTVKGGSNGIGYLNVFNHNVHEFLDKKK